MKPESEFKNGWWTQFKNILAIQLGLSLLCLTAAPAQAQTFSVLHAFTGADGAQPGQNLVLSEGMLYGTTQQGYAGTVFRVATNGSNFTILKNVGSVFGPYCLLLSGTTLYGGGNSFLFRLNTDGSGYENLPTPEGQVMGLVIFGDTLYGTTYLNNGVDHGTVFKVNTNGTGYVMLHRFSGSDGYGPWSGVRVLEGVLFGTTILGGANNSGTIFKLATNGDDFAVLHSFTANDSRPYAGLTEYGGALYGTTVNGNTLFRINPDGTGFSTLRTFNPIAPYGNLTVSGSKLFGTARSGGKNNRGLVYRIDPDGSNFLVLHDFLGSDGAHPSTDVVVAGDTLYGMTQYGGNGYTSVFTGNGTVFSLSMALSIRNPPLDQSAAVGAAADFTVQADGFEPPSYQWFFDGTNAIPDATNTLLHLSNIQPSQAGTYVVVVTDIFGSVTSSPAKLYVIGSGDSTVRSCTEQALRGALTEGNRVTFACDGTIKLTNTIIVAKDTVLDGTGHAVTISGGNNVRVFYVNTNVTLSVVNLAIANGQATNGAGIFNDGGTVNLLGTLLESNRARVYSFQNAGCAGGGLFNRGGMVNATNGVFSHNAAFQAGVYLFAGPAALGGAIRNESGVVNLQDCSFTDNSASSDGQNSGYNSPDAAGGAIHSSGTLNATHCTFLRNSAAGGAGFDAFNTYPGSGASGSSGGSGYGGAIYNLGPLAVADCVLANNKVVGGNGGGGASGYDVSSGSSNGGPGGQGGNGGSAGGVLVNGGTAHVVNVTFASNTAIAGNGGNGGMGGSSPFRSAQNGGNGGGAGNGGSGFCVISGTIVNCTVAFNSATAGSGGYGGAGGSGGIFGGKNGLPGANGVKGQVGSGIGVAWLVNTILSANTPSNSSGTITDAGHNLSSDGSCAFSGIGSLNNTDPKLGPLANNGGPTLTMALLPGSPAINAGDNASAPPTDQRGAVRPSGVACDIGAYECSPPSLTIPPPTQTAEIGTTIEFMAQASTFLPYPPPSYQWFFNGKAITGCTNSVLCLSGIQATNVGAYTVVVSNVEGVVTSSPAMLNVIPVVERRPIPGVKVAGEAGRSLQVEYTDALGFAPSWLTLATLTLTNTSQFCPDLTTPLPSTRFYRAWQTETQRVIPSLNLNFVPAITLTGNVGGSLRLDWINAFGPTNAWVTLDTVTLTNTSQLYFDVAAPGQPARLYRIVPAP